MGKYGFEDMHIDDVFQFIILNLLVIIFFAFNCQLM